MLKLIAVAALTLSLVACASSDLTKVQSVQGTIQQEVTAACATVQSAMALAAPFSAIPQVGAIMDYGTASCIGANAISAMVTKAVNDPATIAWLGSLSAQIKAAVPSKPATP